MSEFLAKDATHHSEVGFIPYLVGKKHLSRVTRIRHFAPKLVFIFKINILLQIF